MNPVTTIREIQEQLQNYIRRTLPVERAMPAFTEPLNDLFSRYPLAQAPYLEIMPGYQTGASLQDLVDERVIHQETADIFAKYFLNKAILAPNNEDTSRVKLYSHQSDAIRAVCRDGRNLVVCSGTGSGKTECFLIPLVNYLVGEWIAADRSEHWTAPGVRAMILYPMNALVNDQIRRLRGILRYAPYITYGKYTGESDSVGDEDTLRQQLAGNVQQHRQVLLNAANGAQWSGAGFDDEAPLKNEVTRRSVWHHSPAHILVTNYSMLERLLLQPETSMLFQEPWKFIILDEAHCYDGALGTEIAWLVRRLKRRIGNPDHLRFMATSATLIDDPNSTIQEKTQRIQDEFASKIFPAPPDTFSVKFGTALLYTPVPNAYPAPDPLAGQVYRNLVDTTLAAPVWTGLRNTFATFQGIQRPLQNTDRLFALTQTVMGVEAWNRRLEKAVELAGQAANPMAAGDALYLARVISDAVKAGLLPIANTAAIEVGMFTGQDSLTSLQALVEFVVAGVGGLHDNGSWRERLHDYGDPRPSNAPNDTCELARDVVRQNRYGNRLLLRNQWIAIQEGDLTQLDLEGLMYLLKSAEDLVILVEDTQNMEMPAPLSVKVVFSQVAQAVIQGFIAQRNALNNAMQQARSLLTEAWRVRLVEITNGQQPIVNTIEELLGWFLGADVNLENLSNQLRTAMANADQQANLAKSDIVAQAVFGNDPNADKWLDALVSLGAMGIHSLTKKPLLDLRYHQLLRGLREVGISFHDPATIQLQASDALTTGEGDTLRAVFTMGVCRTCGQPFVLGYTDVAQLNTIAGIKLMSRMKTEQQKFLHAIAWVQGGPFDDAEDGFPKPPGNPFAKGAANQNIDIWLNIRLGQVAVGVPNPGGLDWIQGYWYVPPHATNCEFLSQCPCCGDQHDRPADNRYGLITPYEAHSEQLKLTLLDELVRHTDPSADPSARRLPGEGRKVLAFSDSRRGAASMAYGYQNLFNNVTMGRLMPEGVGLLLEAPLDARITEFIREQAPGGANVPYFNYGLFETRETELSGLIGVSAGFRAKIDANNCIRLLEVSDANGIDMEETDAAKLRLLQALRKKGRYSLLSRNVLTLESKALQAARANIGTWNGFLNQIGAGMTADQLYSLCNEILVNLFERATITIDAGWPPDELNHWRNHKLVERGPGNGQIRTIRFVSNASSSALNSIVRGAFNLPDSVNGRDQAKSHLESLWSLFAQAYGGSKVLQNDGAAFKFNHNDIVIRLGANAFGVQNTLPHDAYDAYLSSRDIVPVRIEEHTAQLANERGAAYQKAFANGKINILSCSTTFEMGVDLGDLTCVFLSNLPPSVSNYRQRAGRAGRRPGSVAYVLSFVGGTPHEQYYFDRPSELLFGRVQTPQIYLENPVFRARHLRAEALNNFLMWMNADNGARWNVVGQGNPNGAPGVRRKWTQIGHFFVGRRCNSFAMRITATFEPIVAQLSAWQGANENVLAAYLAGIDNVPNPLGYSVARDLVWQLQTQNPPAIMPYPLNIAGNLLRYAELLGPNQPELNAGMLTRSPQTSLREVQERIRTMYDRIGRDNNPDTTTSNPPNGISKPQVHLLNEQTITWLTRNRVLPKYGFPVDVIRLMPNERDQHGRNVDLERDRKIGLYEYAPGQVVMADKRVYPAVGVEVFLPLGINDPSAAVRNFCLCTVCHQPFEVEGGVPLLSCSSCGGTLDGNARIAIQPDAFRADDSKAGNADVPKQRGTPLKVFTGGIRGIPEPVIDVNMATAESETGELLYLNFGPGYQGFPQIQIQNMQASLFHQVKTDIAIWLPNAALFQNGGDLYNLGLNTPRLKTAMQSALEALLRATALELQVAVREIGGITYPYNSRQIGFVLFDESSGGGGAVMPLVLTSDPAIDAGRHVLIRRIIERAIELCEMCDECNTITPFNALNLALIPISQEEWIAPNPPANSRERQSCYKCLRSYGNQRLHHLLDRGDAVVVLRALLNMDTAAPIVPQVDDPGRWVEVQNVVAVPGVGSLVRCRLGDGSTGEGLLERVGDEVTFSYRMPIGQYRRVTWTVQDALSRIVAIMQQEEGA